MTPPLTGVAWRYRDVLEAIAAGGDETSAGLGRKLGKDKSNFAKVLAVLKDAGLVNPARPHQPPLSPAGDAALADMRRADIEAADRALLGAVYLRHDQISRDPDNARKEFDRGALEELAISMRHAGILQPVRVRLPGGDGQHILSMGERRWRAWGILIEWGDWSADRLEICLVDRADDLACMEGSLIENLQRVDLNHMEMAEGYELLATRFGRSNREIADGTGRSIEHVQQHRRLIKLDPAQQDAVRSKALALQEALRAVNDSKPKALDAAATLVLAEVVWSIERGKNRIHQEAEVSYLAKDDAAFKALRERNLLSFTERHFNDFRAYAGYAYAVYDQLTGQLKPLTTTGDADAAAACLREIRVAAVGEELAAAAEASGAFVTSWLNGPFTLSPEAQAALEDKQRLSAVAREEQKAEKAKRAAALSGAQALDADLRARSLAPVDPRLPSLLQQLDIKLPLQLKNGRVFDALGRAVADVNWRFGERGQLANLVLAIAVNAAAGFGANSEGETDADVGEFTPALERLAGVHQAAAAEA